jgi:galactose mutarotase-like enzyme
MSRNDGCLVFETSWYGIPAYSFGNAHFAAIMVPALGGKIASLIDLKNNREWMWKNPDLNPVIPHSESSYLRHLGGWDECFPTVAKTNYPCPPWKDIVVPDHGEIWSMEWNTKTLNTTNRIEIATTANGALLPYKFKRVISFDAYSPAILISYSVENASSSRMPFVWSSHPTLALGPGDKILMPSQQVCVYKSLNDQFGPGGEVFTWPFARDIHGNEWNFSILEQTNSAVSLKLFTTKGVATSVRVEDVSQKAHLKFRLDSNVVSHLGIWLNLNAWSCVEGGPKYYCAAIEPCLGGWDDLSEAFEKDCPSIPANGSCGWALSIELGSGGTESCALS